MSCFPELTYACYVDGELAAEEARRVEAHLALCGRCRRLLESLEAENRLLISALQEPEEEAVGVAARPRDLVWTAAVVLLVAGGLNAALRWLASLGALVGLEWVNPFGEPGQMSLFFNGLFYLLRGGETVLANLTRIGVVALTAALAVGAFLLARRRPRAVGVLVTLAVALGLASPAGAIERRKADVVTVASSETINESLLASGETVNIEGVVAGDLFAFGRRVTLRGTVKGDVLCWAQTLAIEGTVEGNVYSFAQRVHVSGAVARNVYSFAQGLQLESAGRVLGDVHSFSEETVLDGVVGRDANAFSGSTEVRGSVGRNFRAATHKLAVLGSARIAGDLRAYVYKKENIHIDPAATIGGKTETRLRPPRASRYAQARFYVRQALRLVAAFLTGLVLFWLFPFLFGARLETAKAVLQTVGVGFLVLVATPIAIILVAITLIGLPIALLTLAVWLAGLYLAKVFVAAFVGQALLKPAEGQMGAFVRALLVGLLIVFVAVNIPYVGGWISFLILLLGLGAAVLQARRRWQAA